MKTFNFIKSQQLFERAKKVIPGGSQATRLPHFEEYPVYFAKAKGCYAN